MKIAVTGASGQLGQTFVRRLSGRHEVVAFTRRQLDVTDHGVVLARIGDARPDAIFNCAAYTAVDAAEDDASGALAANAFAVRSLARAAAACGATLVHFSTDFVFDGEAATPYTEADAPGPRSIYAQSKLLGEWLAADAPRHYVLRVESLFGGPHPRSSIDRIVDAIVAGGEIRVFVDRVVTPSYVDDVAAATEQLVVGGAPPGLYHCVNSGHATWQEVGLEIARLLERPAHLVPVGVADVPMRAPRPRYCALSNEKLRGVGIDMPPWQDAMRRYLGKRRG
jgi:dTDP-4-dehydrorhamnose reductase